MNLLIRYRADLVDTPEQWRADSQEADGWMHKSLDERKNLSAPRSPELAPPPPGGLTGCNTLRIGASIMSANLLNHVDPVYPPLAVQARISRKVVFSVTVGTDGQIQNLALISGHPLLVSAAREAVAQYVYKPTLLNGQPTAVTSTVDVGFSLAGR